MEFKDILKRLVVLARTHRLFLAICVCVITTVAAGIAYVKPNKFQVSSTLYLEQSVITDLVKGIAVTPTVDSKAKMLAVSMTSRTMLSKVIANLDKDLGMTDLQKENYLQGLVNRLKLNSKERESVYTITFNDSDPIFARDFVNTLVRVFIEENISNKRDDSLEATRFLAEQIEYFKRRIDKAEAAINEYKSEQGMLLAVDDTFLRGEIDAAEKKLESLVISRQELESKRRLFGLDSEDGEVSPVDSPLVQQLRAELGALRMRYTDQHPKVRKAQAQLHAAKQQVTGVGADGSPRQLTPELLQIEINAYKELENRQKEAIAKNKQLLAEIPTAEAELSELERTKENELIIYNQLVARYGQSEVSKQMELQDKSVMFRILDPAVTPFNPMPPSKMHIAILGPIAGLALGLGLLFLVDTMRSTVKSTEQLKSIGLPVLAVVPAIADQAQERRNTTLGWFIIGVTAIYVLVALAGYYLLEKSMPMQQLSNYIKSALGLL